MYRLAWDTPLSAELSPLFRPIRILYDPNRIGVQISFHISPRSPLLVAFPVLTHITYQKQHFILLSLLMPSTTLCRTVPTPASPVSL